MTKKEAYAAVQCKTHGQVLLTDEQFNRQMDCPDALWKCPVCGLPAEFDDDFWENKWGYERG